MFKNLFKFCFIIPTFLIFPCSSIFPVRLLAEELSIKDSPKDRLIKFEEIPNVLANNNLELQSLNKLVKAASYDVSSKISKRYPKLDLNANGLPQYLYSERSSSNSIDTKTSQYQINPSLNLRWNIIDPKRGPEIKSSKNRYEIALNNYEIKKKDLIQEANSRYHRFQKSIQDEKNALIACLLYTSDACRRRG